MVNVKPPRPCGCNPYFGNHNNWCEETPVYAQLVKDTGDDPMDVFPYMIFGLIR